MTLLAVYDSLFVIISCEAAWNNANSMPKSFKLFDTVKHAFGYNRSNAALQRDYEVLLNTRLNNFMDINSDSDVIPTRNNMKPRHYASKNRSGSQGEYSEFGTACNTAEPSFTYSTDNIFDEFCQDHYSRNADGYKTMGLFMERSVCKKSKLNPKYSKETGDNSSSSSSISDRDSWYKTARNSRYGSSSPKKSINNEFDTEGKRSVLEILSEFSYSLTP